MKEKEYLTEYDYNFPGKRYPDWLAVLVIITFVVALLGALWYIIDSVVNN